ncbi:lysozyme C-like isoform X2 [Macrotis lagotis]|uniref:lysozyme C-like isoform X2 n=1 Tax=Macrotis lagotis TaxID=92651 RepID=UPI003D68C0B5
MKALLCLGFIFLATTVHGVCAAYSESSFNTQATHYNPGDRSTDYGPWQINSHYWCNDGKTPNAYNGCHVQCSELLGDDITKSVKCIKQIVREQGMEAWVGWRKVCQGRNLSDYLRDCHL